MPTCKVCRNEEFDLEDGRFVCRICLTLLPTQEIIADTNVFSQSTIKLRKDSAKAREEHELYPDWCHLDAFNYILVRMTKGLIKCGVMSEIRDIIQKMWIVYLKDTEVAFMNREQKFCEDELEEPEDLQESRNDVLRVEETKHARDYRDKTVGKSDEERDDPRTVDAFILPKWMVRKGEEPEDNPGLENAGSDKDAEVMFDRTLVEKKKMKRRNSANHSELIDPSLLTEAEQASQSRRAKRRFLKESRLKLATDSGEEEVDDDTCTTTTTSQSTRSRRFSLIEKLSELFPPGSEFVSSIDTMSDTNSVLGDFEYMTLMKLLSFLHAGLLLEEQLVTQADIIRWIREGFIPFFGAHELLPQDRMRLAGTDSKVIGFASKMKLPLNGNIRRNTCKLLNLLGLGTIQLPPVHLMAEKIIKDLQMPFEMIHYVKNLEKLAFKNVGWRKKKLTRTVPSVDAYAASFVLIAMKLLLGMDGISEHKISEFANQANRALRLEPSSSFFQEPNYSVGDSGQETLFVFDEWMRYIKYRQLILRRHHVPTAIRYDTVSEMDSDYLLNFAKSDGYLLCDRKNFQRNSEVEDIVARLMEGRGMILEKRTPNFTPCLLPSHGLAEQLLRFDPIEFSMLDQKFGKSSLSYAIDYEKVAFELRKAEPPVFVNVCHAPAFDRIRLHPPYHACWRPSKSEQVREIYLKREPVVPALQLDDDDDDISEKHKNLLLYVPSFGYWTRSCLNMERAPNGVWNIIESEMPPTFLWFLNLVSDLIEERPEMVYSQMCSIETMLFTKGAKVLHSLSNETEIKKRLVAALKNDMNSTYKRK